MSPNSLSQRLVKKFSSSDLRHQSSVATNGTGAKRPSVLKGPKPSCEDLVQKHRAMDPRGHEFDNYILEGLDFRPSYTLPEDHPRCDQEPATLGGALPVLAESPPTSPLISTHAARPVKQHAPPIPARCSSAMGFSRPRSTNAISRPQSRLIAPTPSGATLPTVTPLSALHSHPVPEKMTAFPHRSTSLPHPADTTSLGTAQGIRSTSTDLSAHSAIGTNFSRRIRPTRTSPPASEQSSRVPSPPALPSKHGSLLSFAQSNMSAPVLGLCNTVGSDGNDKQRSFSIPRKAVPSQPGSPPPTAAHATIDLDKERNMLKVQRSIRKARSNGDLHTLLGAQKRWSLLATESLNSYEATKSTSRYRNSCIPGGTLPTLSAVRERSSVAASEHKTTHNHRRSQANPPFEDFILSPDLTALVDSGKFAQRARNNRVRDLSTLSVPTKEQLRQPLPSTFTEKTKRLSVLSIVKDFDLGSFTEEQVSSPSSASAEPPASELSFAASTRPLLDSHFSVSSNDSIPPARSDEVAETSFDKSIRREEEIARLEDFTFPALLPALSNHSDFSTSSANSITLSDPLTRPPSPPLPTKKAWHRRQRSLSESVLCPPRSAQGPPVSYPQTPFKAALYTIASGDTPCGSPIVGHTRGRGRSRMASTVGEERDSLGEELQEICERIVGTLRTSMDGPPSALNDGEEASTDSTSIPQPRPLQWTRREASQVSQDSQSSTPVVCESEKVAFVKLEPGEVRLVDIEV